MRTIGGALAVVTALLFSACGGSGPGTTPEQTFEGFQSRLQSGDYAALVDFVPPSSRKQAETQFDEMKKNPQAAMGLSMMGISKKEVDDCGSVKDFMALMLRKAAKDDPKRFDDLKSAKVTDTKVNGDHATVTVKVGDSTETMNMVRADGRWYMENLMR